LLLLDEPAAGLVHQEIGELKKIIAGLRDMGMAVLLVEHHMELVVEASLQAYARPGRFRGQFRDVCVETPLTPFCLFNLIA